MTINRVMRHCMPLFGGQFRVSLTDSAAAPADRLLRHVSPVCIASGPQNCVEPDARARTILLEMLANVARSSKHRANSSLSYFVITTLLARPEKFPQSRPNKLARSLAGVPAGVYTVYRVAPKFRLCQYHNNIGEYTWQPGAALTRARVVNAPRRGGDIKRAKRKRRRSRH